MPVKAFVFCLSVFNYMNADGLDGKFARKTNQGSAIGEIIDHVGDDISMIVILQQLAYLCGAELDTSNLYVVEFVLCGINIFVTSHWMAINDDALYFGPLTDTSVIQLLIIAIAGMTACESYRWLVDIVMYSCIPFWLFVISGIIYMFYTFRYYGDTNKHETSRILLIQYMIVQTILPLSEIIVSYKWSTLTVSLYCCASSLFIVGELIRSKMFKRELNEWIFFVPFLAILFPNFIGLGSLVYAYYLIRNIADALDKTILFKNKERKLVE
jgi:phosphatidylglycerophosphate synthase